jgi:hypothetical protein
MSVGSLGRNSDEIHQKAVGLPTGYEYHSLREFPALRRTGSSWQFPGIVGAREQHQENAIDGTARLSAMN